MARSTIQKRAATPSYGSADMIQTVFRRILTVEIRNKPATLAMFKAFCRQIMNNYALERLRKRRAISGDVRVEDVDVGVERPPGHHEKVAALLQAMQELQKIKPRQAAALMLDAENQTYAQIAEELQVEVATVGRDLRNGKRYVMSRLAPVVKKSNPKE